MKKDELIALIRELTKENLESLDKPHKHNFKIDRIDSVMNYADDISEDYATTICTTCGIVERTLIE